MKKQSKKVLSLLLALGMVLGLLPVGRTVVTAATPITDSDIHVSYKYETDLDFSTSELMNAYHAATYTNDKNTYDYAGNITTKYDKGTFSVTWPGGSNWTFDNIRHLIDVDLNMKIQEYSFTGSCNSSLKLPLFVYQDGDVTKVYGLFVSNGAYLRSGTFSDVGDITDNQYDNKYQSSALTWPSSGKATYKIAYDNKENPTSVTLTILDGEKTFLTKTFKHAGILSDRMAFFLSNNTMQGYNANTGFTVNNVLARKVTQETKEPIVNFINAHPVLIDIANGSVVTGEQYLANKENAQNALNAFAALETGLQDVIKQTPYYSEEVIATLNEIVNFTEGQITKADVTVPFLVKESISLTGTTAVVNHPSDYASAGAWNNWVTSSYKDGVFNINVGAWQTATNVIDITLNEKVSNYSFAGAFKSDSQVPLFVLSDGSVYGIKGTAYGVFNNQATFTANGKTFTGTNTDETVTYDISFDDMYDCSQVSVQIQKQDGTVLASDTITVAEHTSASVLTDHVATRISVGSSGNGDHQIAFETGVDKTAQVVSFVNANTILNTMKKDTSFSAGNYIADDVYAKVTAAKAAYEELGNAALQQALETNGFYNATNINAIITEKAISGLRASFACVSPYLEPGFAVNEANAAAVKANILAARTTFSALSGEQQTAAVNSGLYNASTLNKLYFTAKAYADGSVSISDFTADGAEVLVSGMQYTIPTRSDFGFEKASLTVSFTGKVDTESTIDVDIVVRQSRKVQLKNIRVDGESVLADVYMYVAGNKWSSTASVTDFEIGTADGDTFTTDRLTFTIDISPFWNNKALHQPRWTVKNERTATQKSFKDESETQTMNFKDAQPFNLTQSNANTVATVHSMNITYFDTAKLAVPKVMGASVKAVANVADQGLRFSVAFDGTVDTSAYTLTEYGAVYLTTHSIADGDALAIGYKNAKTVNVENPESAQNFDLKLRGSADGAFAFTDFTVRAYAKYTHKTTGKTFTVYSGNGGNAENGALTRRVVGVARSIFDSCLRNYAGDTSAITDFTTRRAELIGILDGAGTSDYNVARERIEKLLQFECDCRDIIETYVANQ